MHPKCCQGPVYVPNIFQMLLSVTEVLQHLLKPVTIDFKTLLLPEWQWASLSMKSGFFTQHKKLK